MSRVFGVTYCQESDPWEPPVGANTLRFSSIDPDPARLSLQVRGSLLDSLRPEQTPDSCLGVKGSPVQIRPSRLVIDFFRIYFHYARANKRANLLCNGPSTGPHRAPATAPHQDMCQDSRTGSSPVKAPKITEPPRICTTTPDTIPRPPADRRPDAHRVPQLQDAGRPGCSNQACPRRRRREAAGIRAALGRAATTVAIFTATWKQGRILAMAKAPSRGQQPMRPG